MKPIVFEARPEFAPLLDKYLNDKVKEVIVRPIEEPEEPPNAKSRPKVLSYHDWVATEEGRIHNSLFANVILSQPDITAKVANRIQRQLRTRRSETRGRPRIYEANIYDLRIVRSLKLHFLNELVAKGLGLSTESWKLPRAVRKEKPIDQLHIVDILRNFEDWTGIKLSSAVWLLYTKWQRTELAKQYPDEPRANDGGIELQRFVDHLENDIELNTSAA